MTPAPDDAPIETPEPDGRITPGRASSPAVATKAARRFGIPELVLAVAVVCLVAVPFLHRPLQPLGGAQPPRQLTPDEAKWRASGAIASYHQGKLQKLDFEIDGDVSRWNLRDVPVDLDVLKGHDTLSELNLTGRLLRANELAKLSLVPNLRVLDLANTQTADKDLDFVKPLSHLKRLSLAGTPVTHKGIATIALMPDLEELLLHRTKITDACLAEVRKMPRLRQLFAEDTALTGHGVELLRGMQSLEFLDLARTAVDDAGMRALVDIPNLKRIELNQTKVTLAGAGEADFELRLRNRDVAINGIGAYRSMPWDARGATPKFDHSRHLKLLTFYRDPVILSVLRGAPGLEELDLTGRTIGPNELANLSFVPKLRGLKLGHTNITDADLTAVARELLLSRLDLSDTNITDQGMTILGKLRFLAGLNLSGTAVTDKTLATFTNHQNLETLEFARTHIDGSGFKNLQTVRRLFTVNAEDSLLDDEGVRLVVQIPSVTLIKLRGSKVSANTIAQLRTEIAATGRNLMIED